MGCANWPVPIDAPSAPPDRRALRPKPLREHQGIQEGNQHLYAHEDKRPSRYGAVADRKRGDVFHSSETVGFSRRSAYGRRRLYPCALAVDRPDAESVAVLRMTGTSLFVHVPQRALNARSCPSIGDSVLPLDELPSSPDGCPFLEPGTSGLRRMPHMREGPTCGKND